jgi:TDG/mug DNA glycosylase family protein
MKQITKQQLEDGKTKTVVDVIAPGLKVLFCGINPGLYTAAVGHHFGRPGNRFWKALFLSGFTPRLFHPSEQEKLLELGLGITNIAPRSSTKASELSLTELQKGGNMLVERVKKYKPKVLAILGIDAYRKAFGKKETKLGLQLEKIGETSVWVLPNPSGLNAHYTVEGIAELFNEVREAL